MNESDENIEFVKEFLEKMHNGLFVFTGKANELKYIYGLEQYDGQLERARKTKPLAVCLDIDLQKFQQTNSIHDKKILANNCKSWIQTMWLTGCIQEGQGIAKKIEELEIENEQIKIDLEKLSANYNRKMKQLKALERHFNIKPEEYYREEGK